MTIQVTRSEVNEERHYVRLDDKQLKSIIAEAVARAADIDLSGSHVRVERCYVSSQFRDGQGTEYEAEVLIVSDRRLPQDRI
jgi:hypothetical protein